MGTVITSIFWGIVVLGVLVSIHEFGHFVVAKLCGVKVLKFSIGFGRKLFGFTWGETEYFVSLVPLGGYVKMLGEEDFTEEFEGGAGKGEQLKKEDIPPEDLERSFSAQPIWKRLLIASAGPVSNIALAVLLIWGLYVWGVEQPIFKLSAVVDGSPAMAAGFLPGDVIDKVDGKTVYDWSDVAVHAAEKPGKEITFDITRDGAEKVITAVTGKDIGKKGFGLIDTFFVGPVFTNTPADEAGLVEGDRIVAINNSVLESWYEFHDIIQASVYKKLALTIERDGKRMDLEVTPRPPEESTLSGSFRKLLEKFGLVEKEPEPEITPEDLEKPGLIGIYAGMSTKTVSYGVVDSLGRAALKTGDMATMILDFIGELVSGKRDVTQLGGPVTIAKMSGKYASMGFEKLVLFMALLSVNLGIVNLIPIPILDGGQIFFLLIEATMGKPLSVKKRELIQMIGLILIVALFVLVFYVDILRLFGLTMDIN